MPRFAPYLIALLLGCGSNQDEGQTIPQPVPAQPPENPSTPFGETAQVQAYLQQISPFIQEVGQIQFEIDQKIGTSGKATGSNLAPAMETAKPRLQKALDTFSSINPPPLLATLHADIKKLMLLRLNGYEHTIQSWQQEQKDGSIDGYKEAENALNKANQLILKLNQDMGMIHQALEKATDSAQTASP